MLNEDVRQVVENNRDRIVRLAQDLVRIESENHPPYGNEGAVQRFIADFWRDCGIYCDVFLPTQVAGFTSHPAYINLGRSYEGRPVVVARLDGTGGGRSLLFSGHVDTVPAVGEWHHEPFSGVVEDGKLYGRGAFDMKGGAAAMMMAACLFKEMGADLQGDLLVETVPDEEFASGNGTVAARARGYTADAAVITEPTGLNVVIGHRGFRLAQVTITGEAGIPVLGGEMVNPVQHLSPVLAGIEKFRKNRLTVTTEDTVMITKLAANEFKTDELLAVPPECRIEIYWQTMPEESIPDVDKAFERCVMDACVSDPFFRSYPPRISYHLRPMPGSRVSADAEIVKEACLAVETVTGKAAGVLRTFPPFDMFVFNKFCGIPAIAIGPGGDGAHAPDEYVMVEDIIRCTQTYMNLALSWCGEA